VNVYYLDTSAAVKRYVQEIGTSWIQALADPKQGHSLFLVRLTQEEIVSAITRKETKGQTISTANAAKALTDFDLDFTLQYLIIEVSSALVRRAVLLARKHALRGYDAMQLAAALEIYAVEPALIFVSADLELNTAAMTEGLSMEDPNRHP